MEQGEYEMSERMPRCSELACGRFVKNMVAGGRSKTIAILVVGFMVLSGLVPLGSIMPAKAYSQSYSYGDLNLTVVPVPDAAVAASNIFINVNYVVSSVNVDHWSISRNTLNRESWNNLAVDLVLYNDVGTELTRANLKGPGDVGQVPIFPTDHVYPNVPGFAGYMTKGTWALEVTDLINNGRRVKIDYFQLTVYYDFILDITAPAVGDKIVGVYTFKADVVNGGMIPQFWFDGVYISDMVYSGSDWQFTMDSRAYKDGMYSVRVVTKDAIAGTTVSEMRVSEVDNYNFSSNPISLAQPSNANPLSGTQTFELNVPSFVQMATLSIDGIIIATSYTQANCGGTPCYQFVIDTASYSDGAHIVTGTAYDPDGKYAVSTLTYSFSNHVFTLNIWEDHASPISGPVDVQIIVWPNFPQPTTVEGRLYVDGVTYQVISGGYNYFGVGYEFTWNTGGYSNGIHNIMAEVTDNFGSTSTISWQPTVANYQGMTVTINSVLDGDGSPPISGSGVQVTATTASFALKCELFIDGGLVYMQAGTGSTTFQLYFDSALYSDGNHQVAVRAYDPNGNWVQDSWTVAFKNWNVDVTITDPDPTSVTEISGTYNIIGAVTDAQSVDLQIDGLFAQNAVPSGGTVTFSLDTTAYSDTVHLITMVAYAPDGQKAVDSISIRFHNLNVWVNIASTQVAGTWLIVTADAQDSQKAELWLDNTIVYTDNTAVDGGQYWLFFDTKAYHDGIYTLTVRAYDRDGNFAMDSQSYTINNYKVVPTITTPPEVNPPSISGTNYAVVASVTNPTDGQLAELYIDNQLVVTTATITNPLTMRFDTTKFKDTAHYIKVIVYDKENTASSDMVGVIFDNWQISASITSPSTVSDLSGSRTFTVTASNAKPTLNYAVQAELYVDSQLVKTLVAYATSNPYAYSFTNFDTTAYSDGIHTVTAKVYDPDGLVVTDVKVYRFNNWNMAVSIGSPTQNSYVRGTITVQATTTQAADSCMLYVDGMLVGSSNTVQPSTGGTYTFTISTLGFSDGSHSIQVVASYSKSKESASSSVSVIVDNTAPTVTEVTTIYLNGLTAVRASGDKVAITAKVADITSGLTSVQLDASNIGGSSALVMLDDGNHNDGEAGDGVFGSGPIDASGKMGHMRVFVKATDNAGNSYTGSTSVAIDDHLPIVTNTYIVYPGAQTAAKSGDDVRVIAKIVDTTVFVDVVLVLDNSNSIKANWGIVQTDAKKFVDSLSPNDKTAIFSFDGTGQANSLLWKKELDFTQDKNTVKTKIDNIVADDGTPLYDTIYNAIEYAKTSDNMPVVVVLTDGNDCGWWGCYSTKTFDEVKFASVPVFTIGLDPGQGYDPINTTALKGIADTSNGGAYYYSPSTSELEAIYQSIASKIKEFEVGGISSAYVNLLNIGAGSNIPIYDDGSHGDGAADDNVFGSVMITITSGATDEFNYTVHATDVGGNTATLIGKIKIDNTPPTVTSVKPMFQTLNWWASDGDNVRFTADVSDLGNVGGIMTIRLDATSIGGGPNVIMRDDGTNGDVVAADGTYTSDQVQVSTGLATGNKIVTVYCTDIAANSGSGAGTIYIDNHRPMILELVSPASNAYIEGKFTFQVRSNNVAGIDQVQMDIGRASYVMSYNAQSSFYECILDTTTLSDGTYMASIQATDISGKVNPGPKDQKFSIDNTWPVLVLVSPMDGDVVSGLVKIDTTGTADNFLAAVEYQADDLAWEPVSTLWNTTKLTDGEHTLTVRATDDIGHWTTRTIKIIVDNGNPEAYFVTPTTGQALSGKVVFQVWANDLVAVTSVVLANDVSGFMEYNSGTGYYELTVDTTLTADGTYTVGALVADLGGHLLTVEPVTFYIDNGFPVIKVIKPANNAILKGNYSVQLNVTDGPFSPVSVQWKVDDGAWKTLTAMTFWWNTTTYSDAKHTFHVQATDKAGHVVSTSVPVTIDNNPPTVDIASPTNGQYIEGTFIFKMHSYDTVGVDKVVLQVGTVNYTIINNVGTIYFEQPVDTTAFKDGTYNVTVTSYDLCGYTTKTAKIKVYIDNHAPQLTVTDPEDNQFISGKNYTLSGSATDTFMASIKYTVDGLGERLINQSLNTTLLADGPHTIEVMARDLAGHTTTRIIKVLVDNNDPGVNPVSPQQLEPVSGKYTFRVRAEDVNGISTVRLTYSNLSFNLFQNSVTGYYETTRDTTFDHDGPVNFKFTVTDRSGRFINLTIPSRVDNSAPNVTVKGPGEESKGVVVFEAEVSDASGIDLVMIRIGGGEWREMRYQEGEYTFRWKSTHGDNGPQPYDIKVIDKLGNSEIYSYETTVKNPSGKQNMDWLWWILFILLVVCIIAVAATSRTRTTDRPREYRTAPRGYDTKMAAEEEYSGAPRPLPGKVTPSGRPQSPAGPSREIGTPAHRVAVRKLDQDIVVSQPSNDEVTFMDTEADMAQGTASAMARPAVMAQTEDDVQFLDDDDEVSFEPDTGDEVSFGPDGEDEVSFSDDSSDEVSFSDDSGDEVSFSDDSGDEVSFLDEAPPKPAPAPKPPERRIPVALTPKRATATPSVTPKRPPPTVSTGALSGIDDLLAGGGGTPRPGPKTSPKPPTPKPSTSKKGGDPLSDVIGDL